jgi:ubiquitin carboxyl-terminal hydrolase 14
MVKISIKWKNKSFDEIELDLKSTGKEFKKMIYDLTGVPSERQKIIGLKGTTKFTDETEMSLFKLVDVRNKNKIRDQSLP